MKQWFLFHWQRLQDWLKRVEYLNRQLQQKDAEVVRLKGIVAGQKAELTCTLDRARMAEGLLVKAERNTVLLATWIKRTHHLGMRAQAGTMKEILQNAHNKN